MNEELEKMSGAEPAASPVEATEQKAVSARQKALDRTRGRKPERELADDDDEALFGAMNDDYEADNAELEDLRSKKKKMNDFLRTDERSAEFFSDWHRNGSPIPALVKQYGKDIVAEMTNPDIQAQIEADQQEYLKRMAESAELDKQADENLAKSREEYNALCEEGTYSKEQIDNALNSLADKFERWLVNDISKDMIVAEIKALGYDADTEQARRNGRAAGRNENIGKEFERRRGRGDGVPNLDNGGGNAGEEKPKANNGALDRAARPSIWD